MRHSGALAHAGTTQTPKTQRRALSIESLNVRDIAILGTSLWNQNEPSAKICKCFSVDTFECPWQQWQVITSPRVETSRFLSFAGNAWKPNCGSARRGSLWWETRWSFTDQIHTLATFLMIFLGGASRTCLSSSYLTNFYSPEKNATYLCRFSSNDPKQICYVMLRSTYCIRYSVSNQTYPWLIMTVCKIRTCSIHCIYANHKLQYYNVLYVYIYIHIYIYMYIYIYNVGKIICSKKVWMRKDN